MSIKCKSVSQHWEWSTRFGRQQLFFFLFEKRRFTDWNLIICQSLLQQVRRSSAFKYRPKLFGAAAPTLHSWGVWTRQRPFITLMKCAFHLRLWEQNIKTPRIITLKQVPLCDNFWEERYSRSGTDNPLVLFLIRLWKFEVYTHTHTHKRVTLQQINEREEKLVSRDSWFGSRSNRRRRGGARGNTVYETWKERADACFFAVLRGRGGVPPSRPPSQRRRVPKPLPEPGLYADSIQAAINIC